MPTFDVLQGDCLAHLRSLPDNSVSSVVTDPPYGINLMGKKTPWDKVLPDPAVWSECLRVLKPGGYICVFAFDRMYHRVAVAVEDAGFDIRLMAAWIYGEAMPKSLNVEMSMREHDPARALEFKGWGTGLRPSIEPLVIARKPLAGTLTATVMEYGTGAFNLDACRMEGGRHPANVMFDDDTAHLLDTEAGGKKSPFFYCCKPRQKEKDAGLDDFPLVVPAAINGRKEGSAGINNPRAGVRSGARRNTHTTVKPIALMRWLCKLITPPGGTVLDPFTGSGTTGCAAVLEGFDFLGFELSQEYVDIARARIQHWQAQCAVDEITLPDL